MLYQYKCFIPENIAPKGASKIAVYDDSMQHICSIPLGRLTPPNEKPLYSFGLVSDIHLFYSTTSWNGEEKFNNALSYFESQGCAMCIVCGDLTQTGFYMRTNESIPDTEYFDERQMLKYKEICEKHTIPVYEIAGNHESYYNQDITNNLDKWKAYTGQESLSYCINHNNDLFILLGEPSSNAVINDDDFNWFSDLLAKNKDKRCFVFVHSYLEEDSGDAKDYRENSIFDYWGQTKTQRFIDLLKAHSNLILFHGHSHIKLEYQSIDISANYTTKNGFKSVHIPSLGRPRDVSVESNTTPYTDEEAQGYIVDVYNNYIVLNGMDLVNILPIPLGTYKIK